MDPLILEIIVGVLILSSFGVAYMASKTWRVTHVVLLNIVFLTGIVFWYMAARTLKIHEDWRKVVQDQRTQLGNLREENKRLIEGDPSGEPAGDAASGEEFPPEEAPPEGAPGAVAPAQAVPAQDPVIAALKADPRFNKLSLRQLQYELADMVSARGQVWRNISEATPGANGELTLTLDKDHGLAPQTVVYLFERPTVSEGGDFLGEFQVTAAPDETKVQLVPHLPLTPDQLAQLAQVKAPLSVYSTMPTDDPKLLTKLDPKRQQAIIPDEQARQAFAAAGRPLRDYSAIFHSFHAQRNILADEKAKALSDIQRLTDSTKRVTSDVQFRQAEAGRLNEDLNGFRREVQIVTTYLQQIGAQSKKVASDLTTSKANIAQLAAAVTAQQLEDARRVNVQTDSPAETP
jgi:hypothetical protein